MWTAPIPFYIEGKSKLLFSPLAAIVTAFSALVAIIALITAFSALVAIIALITAFSTTTVTTL